MNDILPHYINGAFTQGNSNQHLDIHNPATQDLLARVPMASDDEVNRAVAGAAEAFMQWRKVPVPERARLMLRYQQLLKEHHDELARILAEDNGIRSTGFHELDFLRRQSASNVDQFLAAILIVELLGFGVDGQDGSGVDRVELLENRLAIFIDDRGTIVIELTGPVFTFNRHHFFRD